MHPWHTGLTSALKHAQFLSTIIPVHKWICRSLCSLLGDAFSLFRFGLKWFLLKTSNPASAISVSRAQTLAASVLPISLLHSTLQERSQTPSIIKGTPIRHVCGKRHGFPQFLQTWTKEITTNDQSSLFTQLQPRLTYKEQEIAVHPWKRESCTWHFS